MAKVEINLCCGLGTILIDGNRVYGVSGIEITSVPGQPAVVSLKVFASELLFREENATLDIRS